MKNNKYAIELKGITKTFGSVIANDNINLTVKKGEILSLLGENGSGKTTLMNMLSGVYKPDSGEIFVNGEKVVINSPEDSKRLGIGMVHQHFKLVENFSAADNIWVGAEHEKGQMLKASRYKKIEQISQRFGFNIDTKKKVCDMAVSEKQTVEILKVLYYGAEILILDEPTAVLTLQETRRLFSILRKMRDKGCAIIIITHKLNEVMEISDRVTILRKGKSEGTVNTSETNAQQLTDLMVGHAVELAIDRPKCDFNETLLSIQNLTIKNDDGVNAIEDVSFDVRSGEILGVAGVSGCGQKELCEAIAGLQKVESGKILFINDDITHSTPREIIKHGISMSFIPEDRLGMGLAASLSITDNMMLKNYKDAKGPFVNRKKARASAQSTINELEVVTPSTETPVRRLSGGNVQKVLLGREIESKPRVIVTAYPVRGLDINSSYTIYNILNREKKNGAGVLFVGEDLDVMLELCDKILVLCHGKVTGIVNADQTSKEELGLLMTDALAKQNSSDSLETTPNSCDETQKTNNATSDVQDIEEKTYHVDTTLVRKKAKPHHNPFIRVAKRDNLTIWQKIVLYVVALFAAMVVGGIFVAFTGVNPFEYYKTVITGCFNNTINIKAFINIIMPLIITSLGISFAFKMKFWNIGGNGQFIVGAISATTVALFLQNSLPQWLTLVLMFIAGAVGGGLFGLIPAALKVKFGTNETLLTLMLNYIAYYVLTYLKNTMFFRRLSDTGALLRPDFKILPDNAHMFTLELAGIKFDLTLIIALVLIVITFIYFKFTKQGYEISVVGDSRNTASYAGMNVNRIVLRTMFISAAVIGVAGMLQVCGSATSHTLSEGIASDVGFTGIIVAWLAKLNSFGILATSALLGVLQKGCAVAQSTYHISSAAASILEGFILFTILAADFFIRYKVVFNFKRKQSTEAVKGGEQ